MQSALDHLREMSVLVADTGSIDAIRAHRPVDCTTNPSLVLAAASDPALEPVIAREIAAGRAAGHSPEQVSAALTVAIGAEIAPLVPGRVSTEIEARLSFDTDASVARARAIIDAYAARGITREKVLIKLAATWEGIRAAEMLQRDGIDCNMTLIFALEQAVAAADAGAWLISPFVGRITDWHKKAEGRDSYPPDEDPGVLSVRRIHRYFRAHGIGTIVMAASFRTTDQIRALAGCDRLTIAPKLIDELARQPGPLTRQLPAPAAGPVEALTVDAPAFRWALTADPMANDKLAEGIRQFDADHQRLVALVRAKMSAPAP
ncbi:MAG: transaldolase [Rhodobacteraceae bacterium]|nr:transaldolase [Paracoccaceae bacterium]